ncbi:MAG: helix-turn-helix transcriptional regulator [Alphaproteobacteria bacterium]|nr:helix-turn-helix transcriptional regulator [Alphaproteobacteria bacterium]
MTITARKPDPIDINVGRRIRARRRILHLSQSSLGQAVDVSFQQIQKYEKGTNRVAASKLAQIAAALGVDTSHFYANDPSLATSAGAAGFGEAGQEIIAETTEEARLLGAFNRIASPDLRRNLLEIAERLAEGKPKR